MVAITVTKLYFSSNFESRHWIITNGYCAWVRVLLMMLHIYHIVINRDMAFPRLGQMILDYEIPMKKLAEEFVPHSRVSFVPVMLYTIWSKVEHLRDILLLGLHIYLICFFRVDNNNINNELGMKSFFSFELCVTWIKYILFSVWVFSMTSWPVWVVLLLMLRRDNYIVSMFAFNSLN